MIAAWMVYALLVATLLGCAAHALERSLRTRGLAGRWPWAAALGGAWLLPFLAWVRRPTEAAGPAVPPLDGWLASGPGGAEAAGGATTTLLSLLGEPARWVGDLAGRGGDALAAWTGEVGAWAVGSGVDDVLLWVWVASAAAAVAVVGGAVIGLAGRSRRWPTARVLDERVRLAPDFGPAVLGVVRPEIVLPRWILSLAPDTLRLALRHEQEHRSAGDTALLTAGSLAVLLAPWCLPLWWHLRRLRRAVELDCDRRVVRGGASRRDYGALLLTVGERAGRRVRAPAAALVEEPSFLERRLEMITNGRTNRNWMVAGSGVLMAGVLTLVACDAPAPTEASITATISASTGMSESEVAPVTKGMAEPLIYIDGVRLDGDHHDMHERISPDEIERIEIIKGGAATELFGDEASAGVIQIFSKDAAGAADEAIELEEVPAADAAGNLTRSDRAGPEVKHIVIEPISFRGLNRIRIRGTQVEPDTSESVTPPPDVDLPPPPGSESPMASQTLQERKPLIYVDGVSMQGVEWDPDGGHLDQVPPEDIDHIEVIKGGAAVERYGPEASGGVILIHTKG